MDVELSVYEEKKLFCYCKTVSRIVQEWMCHLSVLWYVFSVGLCQDVSRTVNGSQWNEELVGEFVR
jgi:hypothetical protein